MTEALEVPEKDSGFTNTVLVSLLIAASRHTNLTADYHNTPE